MAQKSSQNSPWFITPAGLATIRADGNYIYGK